MSNEVIKPAEEKVDTENSATESTNKESTAETAAPANAEGAAAAKTPEPTTETTTPEPAAAEEQDAGGEMDFGAMLAQFEQEQVAYHAGEIVSGKVVGISDQVALVDFGYKSEGVVPIEEFTSPEGEITVGQGDEVEVMIKRIGGDGAPNLSFSDAKNRKSWDEIDQAFKDDTVVKGKITAKTKGGLKVDVQGVEAFLPGSQIDSRPIRNLDALIGEEIEAKVVKFSRKRNNIVLSRKVITDLEVNKQKAETLAKIEEGYIVDGVVKNLTDYGVFIDIGGIDGLLHVTDMSWGRLQKPDDRFKVGDTVQVKVLKLDRDKEKVSLGYKQLLPDPWSTVIELYPVESRIKGRISSVTEYGAFVELEPGVEGLVHISEMSWAKRMKHPKHFVSKGDEVEVQVLGIDPDERRISLGIKQLQANPWDTIAQRFQVGSKVQGKVRNLTDFGAFVEIEDGVDGLVHVSDISWSKKIKHPKDVLKKGQEVEAVITNMDIPGHRLSLSIKELTPSAWDTFTAEHKPGDVVKG
ncbi:MAG: 30S ribosomal protein S1, partial [Pyrinomonadaceae bacterium]|nr:30S ribosomal protein S1 [Pyrinomonadaceae bacterium]